jgi:hypothetical protein
MNNIPLWQLSNTAILNPEGTYYYPKENVIFVSSVVGDELEKDGEGWISLVSPAGEILDAKWVEGLNAPHGMRSYQNQLWVADIDELVVIDIPSATVLSRLPISGAEFLNDVAISEAGQVFVSDTLTNHIYVVDANDESYPVGIFAEGSTLESPNGLFVDGEQLLVAGWGNITDPTTFDVDVPGNFFALNLSSAEKQQITTTPLGNLDGIEQDAQGNFIVSDYVAGTISVINSQDGQPYLWVSGLESPADISFLPEGLVVVPSLTANTVTAYPYFNFNFDVNNQQIEGGEGNDQLQGMVGHDLISGWAGDDTLHGEGGNDTLHGNSGNDLLFGHGERDILYGGAGVDILYGNEADDYLQGNLAADQMYGGQGNDSIQGNQGNDVLWGDLGDDQLTGGPGADQLTGGAGRNRFRYEGGAAQHLGFVDEMTDFKPGQDQISLATGQDQVLNGLRWTVNTEVKVTPLTVSADNLNDIVGVMNLEASTDASIQVGMIQVTAGALANQQYLWVNDGVTRLDLSQDLLIQMNTGITASDITLV